MERLEDTREEVTEDKDKQRKPLLCIKPRKPKLSRWRIATFDIETKPVGDESSLIAPFCLGATCRDGKGDSVKFWFSAVSMLEYMVKGKGNYRWFAHNGANFDFKHLLSDAECKRFIEDNGYTIRIIGGDIPKALMFIKGTHYVFLCDSYKLMPKSLDSLCKGFQVQTAKGKIDFETETFNPLNETHLDYLRKDTISLYQVLTKYREVINTEFNQEVRCTASSTAFVCWQGTLNRIIYHHNKRVNRFARNAYYGGRTECFYQGWNENISYIDINSLYAYVMYEYGGIEKPHYTDVYEGTGFYRIRCNVPIGNKFGFIPYRKLDRSGIIFPVGEYESYASSIEIEYAREHGIEIEVLEGYAYSENDTDLFKPFISKCMELRQKDYKGALGECAKFLQNNLYGFFGMNPERDELIYSYEAQEGMHPLIDKLTGDMIPYLWQGKQEEETINCIPSFAAWITSAARTYLLRAMIAEEQAGNEVLYCDTDSIIMKGKPVSPIIDKQYGAFKLEYESERILTITAKTYLQYTDDKYMLRCKGIPSKQVTDDMLIHAGQGEKIRVQFTQMNNLRRTIVLDSFGTDEAIRTVPVPSSITGRVPTDNGWTKPVKLPNEKY
jgi:DNA polymerase type B, organellar and viral